MILFMNVFLANAPISPMGMSNARYLLRPHNTLEAFRYTIHSYAVLPWEQAYFYVELDTELLPAQEALHEELFVLFPGCVIFPRRNAYQRDWQTALEPVVAGNPHDLIWYAGNHDHPFIDYDLEQYTRLVTALNAHPDPLKGACYSHFYETYHFFMQYPDYRWEDIMEGVGCYRTSRTEAMLIVSKALLKSWWWDAQYGDTFLPRTDWKGVHVKGPEFACFMPLREMCRHFDGYNFRFDVFNPHDIPPLDVPEGFWEREIKIQFGGEARREGWTWLQPLASEYRALHPEGADYKGLPEDIPLFWQGRIEAMETLGEADRETLRRARNRAYAYAAAPRRDTERLALEDWWKIAEAREKRPYVPMRYLRWLWR